jgi:hypothetical protein
MIAVLALAASMVAAPDRLDIPRVTAPPVVDGMIGEDEWAGAAVITLDHQTEPGDNTSPSVETEVRFGYDGPRADASIRPPVVG